VLLVLVVVVRGLYEAEYEAKWEDFVKRFQKKYHSTKEVRERFNIFKANVDYIEAHNSKKGISYGLGVNKFADLTNQEFREKYLGFKPTPHNPVHKQSSVWREGVDRLPNSWDWRDHKAVTFVKDQGQCGSCWSFSAIGAIEGAWAIHTKGKHLTSLSEQNIIDCTWNSPYNNTGCDGGDMRAAIQYVIDNQGVDTEESYPYEDSNGGDQEQCTYSIYYLGAEIKGMGLVISGNETDLAYATLRSPVSVGIDASHQSFQLYSWGIYDEPACQNGINDLDHGVTVVGFGDGYWLVKNSWGTDWGWDGYIQMSRDDDNQCGIATYATIALCS